MTYVAIACRFSLAAVFLVSGISKSAAPARFEKTLGKYDLLLDRLVRPTAIALPTFEVICATCLLLGIGTVVAAAALAVALIGFTVFVGNALRHRKVIDCGCFGPTAPRKITWLTVGRNLLLFAMAIVVVSVPDAALSIASGLVLPRSFATTATEEAFAIALGSTSLTLVALVVSEGARVVRATRSFGAAGES